MITKEINDKELTDHLNKIHKDEMSVFVMADGRVRGALFHGTKFVNQARAQHNLGILETMLFGQAALCGALLLPTMKGKERKVWHYECDGSAKGFTIDADSTGHVRGYLDVDHIPLDKPLESWDLTPFLGNGYMTMTTMQEFDKEPSVSSVDILYKNITKDLAWYFLQSEQITTAFTTSIFMDKQGRVTGAGGMFIQVLPETGGTKIKGSQLNSSSDQKADEELITRVENAISACPSLGKWFSDGGDLEDIIYGLFREFNPKVAVTRDVFFDCPCTKEFYLDYLNNLPEAQKAEFKKGNEPLEIVCKNCGSVYTINLDEF